MADGAAQENTAHTGGLLLAGGRSHRFGAEKAVARFGQTLMMDAVAERFEGFPFFAVSAKPGSAAAQRATLMHADVVYDDPALPSGPLAGVFAGLAWAQANALEFLATAPCDAPLLPRDLFERLLDAIGAAPAAYAKTASGEHPLCAIWRVRLKAPLEQALTSGNHPSVRSFLSTQGARGVRFEDAHAFANANTKDMLVALEHSS
jgi:molybdopterin-guanine dinucleotide biosynthesis protein A